MAVRTPAWTRAGRPRGGGEKDVMTAKVTNRRAVDSDLSGIAAIYAHEIANSVATFDLEPPTLSYWEQRLTGGQRGDHLMVAVDADEDVVGYAYSWSYRPRPAYFLTRETSIYLDPSVRGHGIGRVLYPALLDTMAARGVHTAGGRVGAAQPGPGPADEDGGLQ